MASKANLTVIRGGIVDAVPPPKGLPESQVADWNTITASLAARGALNEGALLNVRAYCAALETVRECSEQIERDGRFVKNKDNIPRAHPALSHLQKATEMCNRFAVQFGLTPSSKGSGGPAAPAPSDDGIEDFV